MNSVDDLLAHGFNHLLSLGGRELNGALFQNRSGDDNNVLASKDVFNGIAGRSLTAPGVVKYLVHGEKIVDVNLVGRLLKRLNKGRVNQNFVAFSAFFQAGENGLVQTHHTITYPSQR